MTSSTRLAQHGAVRAAVKDASRRLRRWPLKSAAILDRGTHRAMGKIRPGRENGASTEPENIGNGGVGPGFWMRGVLIQECSDSGVTTVRYVSERTSSMSPA